MTAEHEEIKAICTGLLRTIVMMRSQHLARGDHDDPIIPAMWFHFTEDLSTKEREAAFIDPPPPFDSWCEMPKEIMVDAMEFWLRMNRPDYIGHVSEAWAVHGANKDEAARAVDWMNRGLPLKDFPGSREIVTLTVQSSDYNLQLTALLPRYENENVEYKAFDSDAFPDFEIAGRVGKVADVLKQPLPGSIDVD